MTNSLMEFQLKKQKKVFLVEFKIMKKRMMQKKGVLFYIKVIKIGKMNYLHIEKLKKKKHANVKKNEVARKKNTVARKKNTVNGQKKKNVARKKNDVARKKNVKGQKNLKKEKKKKNVNGQKNLKKEKKNTDNG